MSSKSESFHWDYGKSSPEEAAPQNDGTRVAREYRQIFFNSNWFCISLFGIFVYSLRHKEKKFDSINS